MGLPTHLRPNRVEAGLLTCHTFAILSFFIHFFTTESTENTKNIFIVPFTTKHTKMN